MKLSASELLNQIPGKRTELWLMGERFKQGFAHGSMSVELYAPIEVDPQHPHDQDELYFIHSGSGVFTIDGNSQRFQSGDCFFVAAGVPHRFENFSPDFSTWVVFWGPPGGESP